MEKYPKVYALGHKYIQDIFEDEVLVEEKVDGCFRGDTLIRLANGKTETISKIVNNKLDIEVLSYNKNTKIIEPKKVINWFKFQNNEPFYKIKIKGQGQHRNWNNLYATNNHNIFTNTGKKQVKDLKIGDIIFRPQYRLDYIQEQMILGSLLGDSSLSNKDDGNVRFSVGHSIKEYTDLKELILSNIPKRRDIRNGGYADTKIYNVHTKSHPEFTRIANITHTKDNKKFITKEWCDKLGAIGLAFWYMDDGSFSNNIVLHSNAYSYEENLTLIDMLKRFGIIAVIGKTKKYYYIRINQNYIESFFVLIAQYIPKFMDYKLSTKYKNLTTFWDSGITTIQHEQPLVESEILSIETDPIIKLSKYDIEVADNHNYFAENILVSNSQLNFSKGIDNSINVFSRTVKQDLDNPDKMFSVGVEYILSIQDKLIPGYNYHGEYLNKPKHNILPYGRIPKNNIIIFDIEDVDGKPLLYDDKVEEAALLGLETVPRLYYGKLLNATELFKYLDNTSILGNEKIEGVVVKNYNKYTTFNTYYVGKFVSERFKEKHVKDWKERNVTNKDIISNLITELKTEARWYKAVQHLKESGKFLGEPKDIGELFKLVIMDIDEEEQDYIKDVLYKHFVKDIKKHVTYGLPEWYKIKLAEGGL